MEVDQLQVPQQTSIRLETHLEELHRALSWFNQLNRPPLPRQTWMQCKIALTEAFTNAVRHAHKSFPREVPIEIEICLSNKCIEMRIWDFGPPFDLELKLKSLPKEMDLHSTGGRGLPLLKKIADSLSYTKMEDERNCLLIVKDYA
ncbi:MAG: ATP-binding protein [Oscillatoria sp. SIO1A7]|nr:ATP-binding protein [Oscillatoria sp. SIO1A7]